MSMPSDLHFVDRQVHEFALQAGGYQQIHPFARTVDVGWDLVKRLTRGHRFHDGSANRTGTAVLRVSTAFGEAGVHAFHDFPAEQT